LVTSFNQQYRTTDISGAVDYLANFESGEGVDESRFRKSAQDDKWSFCLTVGTLCPANQERP
jgi:hypothetical protein